MRAITRSRSVPRNSISRTDPITRADVPSAPFSSTEYSPSCGVSAAMTRGVLRLTPQIPQRGCRCRIASV